MSNEERLANALRELYYVVRDDIAPVVQLPVDKAIKLTHAMNGACDVLGWLPWEPTVAEKDR